MSMAEPGFRPRSPGNPARMCRHTSLQGPSHRNSRAGGGRYRGGGGGQAEDPRPRGAPARAAEPGPRDRAPDRRAAPQDDARGEAQPAHAALRRSDEGATPTEARKPIGSVFSETDPVLINKYQHDAVENSRLHIPILFAFDTIHGFRTIFPIPLGTASSFDPSIAQTDHRIGAFESAAVGLKQIYSPMLDLSHEPRWGRISEASGEDPYLNSVMGAARVKGAQGNDYSAPDKVATSIKHFAAYGEPDAGRDYNTTDMSIQRLWNFYLPPFKAAVDAGADTAMCAFNALNGVPGLREPLPGDRHPQEALGLRRLHRERLHGRGRAAPVSGSEPGGRPVRARRGGGRQGGREAGPQRRNRHRDGVHELPRLRQVAREQRRGVEAPDRRRRAAAPAGEVPRRPVREPVRGRGRGSGQAAAPREPRRGPQGGRAVARAAEERRPDPGAAARPRQVDRHHRPARQRQARHARTVVGTRATTTTPSRCSTR